MMDSSTFDVMSQPTIKDFFKRIFDSDFMPHGHCYFWRPDVLWINVISDGVIALAYFAIPVILIYFVVKRKDVPFNWLFVMFGVFIIGCGITHVMDVWTVWHGTYRLAGIIKLFTAIFSILTAVAMVPIIPRALSLPSQEILITGLSSKKMELEKANYELGQFNNLALGREERIIELKKEVNRLSAELGKPLPYTVFDESHPGDSSV